MVTYYCPSCWAEIHENTEICSHCEFNIGAFGDLEYEQKLINAAFHPIPENRYMAIEALGMLKTPRTLPTLARILHEEKDDIYLLYQVLKALANIPDSYSKQLLEEVTHHSYRLIRQSAERLLNEQRNKQGTNL